MFFTKGVSDEKSVFNPQDTQQQEEHDGDEAIKDRIKDRIKDGGGEVAKDEALQGHSDNNDQKDNGKANSLRGDDRQSLLQNVNNSRFFKKIIENIGKIIGNQQQEHSDPLKDRNQSVNSFTGNAKAGNSIIDTLKEFVKKLCEIGESSGSDNNTKRESSNTNKTKRNLLFEVGDTLKDGKLNINGKEVLEDLKGDTRRMASFINGIDALKNQLEALDKDLDENTKTQLNRVMNATNGNLANSLAGLEALKKMVEAEMLDLKLKKLRALQAEMDKLQNAIKPQSKNNTVKVENDDKDVKDLFDKALDDIFKTIKLEFGYDVEDVEENKEDILGILCIKTTEYLEDLEGKIAESIKENNKKYEEQLRAVRSKMKEYIIVITRALIEVGVKQLMDQINKTEPDSKVESDKRQETKKDLKSDKRAEQTNKDKSKKHDNNKVQSVEIKNIVAIQKDNKGKTEDFAGKVVAQKEVTKETKDQQGKSGVSQKSQEVISQIVEKIKKIPASDESSKQSGGAQAFKDNLKKQRSGHGSDSPITR